MLFPSFHASCGNRPDLSCEVDLAPRRASDLTSATSRQYQKLQGKRSAANFLPQRLNERVDLFIGQRGVVFDPLDLGCFGQQFVEVALEPCWILPDYISGQRTGSEPQDKKLKSSSVSLTT